MRERPILFSGPMVRAILSGKKSQTRRVVKPQPEGDPDGFGAPTEVGNYHPTKVDRHGEEYPGDEAFGCWTPDGDQAWRCPYGAPGDRLWVRETWAHDSPSGHPCEDHLCGQPDHIYYKATETHPEMFVVGAWRRSIHMPRWASRLTLEVTDVRAERLQEITTHDCFAEGLECEQCGYTINDYVGYGDHHLCPIPGHIEDQFRVLWDSLNKRTPWESNPWVWVITFERMP